MRFGSLLTALAASLILSCAAIAADAPRIAHITTPRGSPQRTFASDDLERALRRRGFVVRRYREAGASAAGIDIRFISSEFASRFWGISSGVKDTLPHESFALRRATERGPILIIADDEGGAMYGGLELAEQIRMHGIEGVHDTDGHPYMPLRGTKFNLPLDLRTPSYSDMSDSAQANIDTVWDLNFWHAYLDRLARDRYNLLSLWNLHPFPSMVKVPNYADVALDDVWRTRAQLDEDYPTRGTGLVTPAMLANHEVVKRLTIEQKIEFWRSVMQYAHNRNIDVQVITWNIFTYGVDGKYGIDDSIDNAKTRDYFRASVREMFHTYPLLRGIGLTVGENMGDISGASAFQRKEDWAFATYGQGVMDAARAEPNRPIRLIHRQHEARAQDIAATFAPVRTLPNIEFVFSFKYAQAHALSSTTQTFHRGYLEQLGDLKTLWTIRNDDALLYRWAAPDFVREFVKNIPLEKSAGFYVGSDMWIWGREFTSRSPVAPRQLEIEKHWLHTLLWGRLGYDPTLDDERIADLVGARFPGVDARKLLAAWQDASMIYPLVTGFHWADFDFQWYIEACRSRPAPAKTASGFHSVETFIAQPVHPGTDNVPIPAYVAALLANGKPPAGTTPPEVARSIDARANAALLALVELDKTAGSNGELAATLGDIRIMALLGKYYAAKIRGATALAEFRATKDVRAQSRAVGALQDAEAFWLQYTQASARAYKNPLWTNRVGIVDWQELNREVHHDVEIAQARLP